MVNQSMTAVEMNGRIWLIDIFSPTLEMHDTKDYTRREQDQTNCDNTHGDQSDGNDLFKKK